MHARAPQDCFGSAAGASASCSPVSLEDSTRPGPPRLGRCSTQLCSAAKHSSVRAFAWVAKVSRAREGSADDIRRHFNQTS